MSRVGPTELLIILLIVLLLFGSTKLPQLAKGAGEAIREFKKAAKAEEEKKPQAGDKSDSDSKGA